jgi:hypothetical protein
MLEENGEETRKGRFEGEREMDRLPLYTLTFTD